MALEADQAVDRRRLKRRLSFWRAAAVIAVAALVVIGVTRSRGGPLAPLIERAHVERLAVTGVISEDPARSAALKEVLKDNRVKALIVDINSPGGTVVGSEELFRELRAIAA